MTKLNETTIKTEPVILIWDNVSRPSVDKNTGKETWGVTVALRKDSATYREMREMSDLSVSKAYPTGKPFKFKDWETTFDPAKYPELNPAEYVFVKFTDKGPKPAFNGTQEISRDEFSRTVYTGAKIAIVGRVWCYLAEERTQNQTGLKWFYEGVQIVDAVTAPRFSVAKGMTGSDIASAFGAASSAASAFTPAPAAAPATAAAVPTPAAPLVPNPGIVPPVPTPKLTALGHTVDTLKAAGWTTEQMRAEGYVM